MIKYKVDRSFYIHEALYQHRLFSFSYRKANLKRKEIKFTNNNIQVKINIDMCWRHDFKIYILFHFFLFGLALKPFSFFFIISWMEAFSDEEEFPTCAWMLERFSQLEIITFFSVCLEIFPRKRELGWVMLKQISRWTFHTVISEYSLSDGPQIFCSSSRSFPKMTKKFSLLSNIDSVRRNSFAVVMNERLSSKNVKCLRKLREKITKTLTS